MSDNKDCHESRFSIVSIVISVSNVTSPYDCSIWPKRTLQSEKNSENLNFLDALASLELVILVLAHFHFPTVNKLKQSIHVIVHSPDTLQIYEQMWVKILQDIVQDQRGCRQDQCVGLNDLVFTGNGHITKMAFIPMAMEGPCKVLSGTVNGILFWGLEVKNFSMGKKRTFE